MLDGDVAQTLGAICARSCWSRARYPCIDRRMLRDFISTTGPDPHAVLDGAGHDQSLVFSGSAGRRTSGSSTTR